MIIIDEDLKVSLKKDKSFNDLIDEIAIIFFSIKNEEFFNFPIERKITLLNKRMDTTLKHLDETHHLEETYKKEIEKISKKINNIKNI